MSDVTKILSRIEEGDSSAAEQLLPLVYEELRKLAAARLARENPGQTLQATALVHEAYLRLVDVETVQHWDSRGHFFSAAAEAMRRILVDAARRKQRPKHGGDFQRVALDTSLAGWGEGWLGEAASTGLTSRLRGPSTGGPRTPPQTRIKLGRRAARPVFPA